MRGGRGVAAASLQVQDAATRCRHSVQSPPALSNTTTNTITSLPPGFQSSLIGWALSGQGRGRRRGPMRVPAAPAPRLVTEHPCTTALLQIKCSFVSVSQRCVTVVVLVTWLLITAESDTLSASACVGFSVRSSYTSFRWAVYPQGALTPTRKKHSLLMLRGRTVRTTHISERSKAGIAGESGLVRTERQTFMDRP